MSNSLIVILMGSKADEEYCRKIADAVRAFGLKAVLRIGSAHKTPQHVSDMLHKFESDPRPKVYITVAGRSNALSAFADGLVTAPVIACPPPSDAFGGGDILSSLHTPSGIAPAVVLEPANAALLAAKILGLSDPALAAKVAEYQKLQAGRVVADDKALGGAKV
jgi:5-(carboxyamino)imidazole ribonucleotide mutase